MDAYQQAVEYLTANPDKIPGAWFLTGPLFRFASYSGRPEASCGCLTMIRRGGVCPLAATDELTRAIQDDMRLPDRWQEVTVDHLPIFAGWQRRIDQVLGRTPPAMDPSIPLPTGDIEIPEATPVSVTPEPAEGWG